MRLRVETDGLEGVTKLLGSLPKAAAKARRPAINTTTRYAYAESSREIRGQVAFTRNYLGSATSGNRLRVTRWASEERPEAVIQARKRATSLARFAQSKSFNRKAGVTVSVAPGSAKRLPGAFLMKLNSGASKTEDQYNVGLALRLKPGQRVFNKSVMIPYSRRVRPGRKKVDSALYMLYGPSVDQVFRSVALKVEPRVSAKLREEFLRQFERFANG